VGKAKPCRGNPSKITAFRWKRGQSGNPKGRPRKEPLTDILRQVLAEKMPNGPDRRHARLDQVLVRNWVLEAIRTKDTATIVEIFNRIDGKVQGRIALGGDDGEPIRIQPIDARQFTDEELRSYEALIRKATTPRSDD
jgi:hypothetical protein